MICRKGKHFGKGRNKTVLWDSADVQRFPYGYLQETHQYKGKTMSGAEKSLRRCYIKSGGKL